MELTISNALKIYILFYKLDYKNDIIVHYTCNITMYWSISRYINFSENPLEVLNTFLKEIEGDSLLITESTSGFDISSSYVLKIL